MKIVSIISLLFIALTSASAQHILVDHNSVALFDHIPPQYAAAAAQLRMLFMDRSVGANINDALSCLSQLHNAAPNSCKRYAHRDSAYAVDPVEVHWEGTWDRSNWRYEFWPDGCSENADCFIGAVEPRIDSFDVVGFQFSYLAVTPGSKIADPSEGFFGAGTSHGTAAGYAAFASRHPEKTVIWWTTSLARGIGTIESQEFNEAMRDYELANSVVLFDVADILSHAPDGNPCYDNRDGVQYLDEDLPDDGLDIPAICPQYTTETNGGHLGSISAGGIRTAKAFWVLMACIAGWDGDTSGTSAAGDLTPLPDRPVLTIAPHPVSEVFTVSFHLERPARITLELYDMLGIQRTVILDAECAAGWRDLQLRRPAELRSGMYFLRLRTVHATVVRPLLFR